MGILKVEGLGKAFGIETLFSKVSFEVRRGDKVGLIGANGTGKSTLMKILMGFQQADEGHVSLPMGETIGYVEQEAALGEGTLYDEFCAAFRDVLGWQADMGELERAIAAEQDETKLDSLMKQYSSIVEKFERAGGYDYESTIRRVAFGLGFADTDMQRSVNAFSGGQKTRICLAKALIRQPDFLFLDEPTNHLDIGMVEWLEEFLVSYPGGVLIISHDRFFLDRVASRIIELESGTITAYSGNYTTFLQVKAERMAALESAYEKQQSHIVKTEEYIRRYKAGIKSKQARGREKQLHRLERIVLPPESARFNFFAFNPPSECAERVAEYEEVSAGYGAKDVFERLSLLVRRGDGVALVGPNGAGKTTMLKLLTGDLAPTAGRIKLGSRVKIGYFSQQHEGLNSDNRLIDEIMHDYGLSEDRARHYLGAFLFSGDDVFKIIKDLSGGEKSRLAFLKLMLTGANFLVLDEPTNHLDIPAKEAVEEAIMSFPGTFITVSHDRYFLDKVANCVVELADGKLVEYTGNYSYYREKKLVDQKNHQVEKPADKEVDTAKKGKPRQQRPQDKEKLAKKIEGEIAMLEAELKAVELQLNDPSSHSDPAASQALANEHSRLQAELEAKYEEWVEVQ
ncbi:ABC-F family ATP-binding cassette domain-containing protein [Dendrosporobacter sp. 1207_IL3150]|uniref:ABC-F family ATP-binding cassette domain-containing protein n=1 Tax=Dendrosporobacter sp. 1207_IL3150 TaxID=3084054 RepID=UPI002FDAE850